MSGTVSSTIVVGVDGSPESVVATWWAAAEARRRRADLVVLAAVRPYAAGLPGVALTGEHDDHWPDAGRRLVDTVTQRLRHGFPDLRITGAGQERDPRTALVDASWSAVMTVVGKRGSGRLPDVLTGSVALYVASRGRSPVAVIPGDPEPSSGPVLVGVDPLGTSQAAIDLAFDEATLRRAELVAVLAGDPVVAHQGFARRPVRPSPVQIQEDQAVLSEQLSGWSEKYPDVTVHQLLLNGRPAVCLARFADLTGCDRPQLTVVGTRGPGSLAGLVLGSTSHDLIASATGPVLVVPTRDDHLG
jgi:nucleotide-binding universal stress UspA family protein